jgi:hypothetical protein
MRERPPSCGDDHAIDVLGEVDHAIDVLADGSNATE